LLVVCLRHPSDKVVETALGVSVDAVSHLQWAAVDAHAESSSNIDSCTVKQIEGVSSLLPAVMGCLSEERLRRPARLCFSAAVARHGLPMVLDILLNATVQSKHVRVVVCRVYCGVLTAVCACRLLCGNTLC
jgi:hypothetical protein